MKEKNPLVSIITIVLNDEEGIQRTIESVIGQSYDNIEYIVIDGGSTDKTLPTIKQYEGSIAYWISEKDQGISDAFNKGIAKASGTIVGIINAGDWYERHAVDEIVTIFRTRRDIGVVCGSMQFWHDSTKEYISESDPDLLMYEMTVTHPTCFVRRELYVQYGLFNLRYKLAMDYEFLLRLKINGVSFYSHKSVLANMNHDGISEQQWKESLFETHNARCELIGKGFHVSKIYLFFLIFKRYCRIQLERIGLDFVLRVYRANIARVKKVKNYP